MYTSAENSQPPNQLVSENAFAINSVVVSLLDFAAEALSRDADLAGKYINDATALLRAQCQQRGPQVACGTRGALAPWQLRLVKQFVEAKLSMSIRMDDLAALTRLSPHYFSSAFRRTVGETPFGYLRRCRVEHAQQLMLLTEKSLAEIALECGLADQAHLTKCFRALVGDTPAAWRRMRRVAQLPTYVEAVLGTAGGGCELRPRRSG
jgi:AraC family transcriptional regulator